MPMSNEEKARTLGLAQVERLQSEGMTAIEQGGDANAVADQLLALSQQTADAMVSEVAMRGRTLESPADSWRRPARS